MPEDERLPWTQHRRFEFIEWKLYWEGSLNRSDLERQFEISTPQASVDLKRYRDAAGANIDYDPTGKAFVPGAKLAPRFLSPSADRLLLQLRAYFTKALPRRDLWFKSVPGIDMAPDIVRHVDPERLRLLLRSMRTCTAIGVNYQSLTSTRWRKIAPHALAYDGHRWHLRAWACDRNDFRDFVLSRITEIGGCEAARYDPADDFEWNTFAVLRLRPHAGLSHEQSLAIQRDFEMEDGFRDVKVRLAMAYYFIKRMNLDLDDLPPARAQIRLENIREVEAAIEKARLETRTRIEGRSRQSGQT